MWQPQLWALAPVRPVCLSLFPAAVLCAFPLQAGDAAPYQYLVESIRKFPRQEELCEMMREAGLGAVGYENYTAGVVALHSGFKL